MKSVGLDQRMGIISSHGFLVAEDNAFCAQNQPVHYGSGPGARIKDTLRFCLPMDKGLPGLFRTNGGEGKISSCVHEIKPKMLLLVRRFAKNEELSYAGRTAP
jgi:hypothetical protein